MYAQHILDCLGLQVVYKKTTGETTGWWLMWKDADDKEVDDKYWFNWHPYNLNHVAGIVKKDQTYVQITSWVSIDMLIDDVKNLIYEFVKRAGYDNEERVKNPFFEMSRYEMDIYADLNSNE